MDDGGNVTKGYSLNIFQQCLYINHLRGLGLGVVSLNLHPQSICTAVGTGEYAPKHPSQLHFRKVLSVVFVPRQLQPLS